MRKTGYRNKFLQDHPGAKLPKELRGESNAQYCPNDETDWLLGENKEYKRVVTLDSDGFVTCTYMKAKWVPNYKGKCDRESIVRNLFIFCAHV